MESKNRFEPVLDKFSKVGSAINKTAHEVNEGIKQEYSIVEFHNHAKDEGSTSVRSVLKTATYAGVSELIDPVQAAKKAITGKTLHGDQVSLPDRLKAAGEVALTFGKLPKTAKAALRVAQLGAKVYGRGKGK